MEKKLETIGYEKPALFDFNRRTDFTAKGASCYDGDCTSDCFNDCAENDDF